MRPPICTICNERFSPASGAGLIYFTESDSDKERNKRFEQPGFVGHKQGHEWFCAKHYADAKTNKHLTASEYKALVKSRFRLIQPYTQEWAIAFEKIANIFKTRINDNSVIIHHVGSTAVPGLGAKAIIDIDIELPDAAMFSLVSDHLSALGYTHKGDYGIPERDVFKREDWVRNHPVLDQVNHHLYVCPPESRELKRHLAFRDYLREHAWARDEYEGLKQEIASTAKQDKAVYSELKEARARAFVERILGLAEKA